MINITIFKNCYILPIFMSVPKKHRKPLKVKFFKALADPIRLDIIDFLGLKEKCVCEIVEHLDIVQPLASRHLKILRESGLLVGRKVGTKKLYKLSNPKIKNIIDSLDEKLLENLSATILQEIL